MRLVTILARCGALLVAATLACAPSSATRASRRPVRTAACDSLLARSRWVDSSLAVPVAEWRRTAVGDSMTREASLRGGIVIQAPIRPGFPMGGAELARLRVLAGDDSSLVVEARTVLENVKVETVGRSGCQQWREILTVWPLESDSDRIARARSGDSRAAADDVPAIVGTTPGECAVSIAGLGFLTREMAKSRAPVVVVEQTTLGVPGFAFFMFGTANRSPEAQGFPMPDSGMARLDAVNRATASLSECLGSHAEYRVAPDSVVFSLFHPAGIDDPNSGVKYLEGWTRFHRAYAGSPGFAVASRPLVAADSTWALLYVGYASGWQHGEGRLLRLERRGGRWVVRATARRWFS